MILADYHVHSDFSSDGKATMEQMVEKAIQLGLKKLCFTDHMDYEYPQTSNYSFLFDPEAHWEKLNHIREHYRDRIDILAGIELGMQPHIKNSMGALVNSYYYDFIIGSTHVVDKVDPYYPEYWHKITEEDGILKYFQSIIDNCKAFNGFHVCGHIDYIIRYAPTTIANKPMLKPSDDIPVSPLHKEEAYRRIYSLYSYDKYADILDEVLNTLLSMGKGIEVNTSGLRFGLKYAHPRTEILKRYRELGGELITIGSDAHSPEQLSTSFEYVAELLKSLGYRYYATFVKGKPVMERL